MIFSTDVVKAFDSIQQAFITKKTQQTRNNKPI